MTAPRRAAVEAIEQVLAVQKQLAHAEDRVAQLKFALSDARRAESRALAELEAVLREAQP